VLEETAVFMTSTAQDLGKPGYDTTYGFGIPQADAAVAAAP